MDVAYAKLDAWIAAKDKAEGGALTRALLRRQVRTTVERMRRTVADSYWIKARGLPGGARFVREMDQLLTELSALADKDVADVHAKVVAADRVVTRTESRLDELLSRISTLIVVEKVPPTRMRSSSSRRSSSSPMTTSSPRDATSPPSRSPLPRPTSPTGTTRAFTRPAR